MKLFKAGIIVFLLPFFLCFENPEKYNNIEFMSEEISGYCGDFNPDDMCIPFKNFTFQKIWSDYPPELVKDLINKKVTQGQNYNKKLEARVVDNETVQLFAKEDIQAGEELSSFNYKDSLSVSSVNFNLFTDDFVALKKNIKKGLPELFLPEDNKSYEKFFNMIINLLLHLYNIQYSKIKEQILILPRTLDKYGFFHFTPYEIENLMKGDEIQGKFQTMHSYFSEGYKLFKETIMTSWPRDIIIDLFHVDEFPYQDFVYCLAMYLFRYQDQLLPNIFHNNNERQYNKPANYTVFNFEFLNRTSKDEENLDDNEIQALKKIKIISPMTFQKGSKIILDYSGPDSQTYIITGEYKEEEDTLEYECFDIFWLNPESSKRYYNEPTNSCLTKELLFHYYVFSNYVNLIGRDFSDCNKLLKTIPNRNISFDGEKDRFIYENCVHPEWKTNFFEFAEKQLDERDDNFRHDLKKISDYFEFRTEKNLTTDTAVILKQYLKLRLKLIGVLKKEMRRLENINKENRNSKLKKEDL